MQPSEQIKATEEYQKDIDRVGLSEEGHNALIGIMDDDHFKDKMSCYRFSIAIALRERLDIRSHNVIRPSGHMYLISQIDPDGYFGVAIEELNPSLKHIKYRALEKYADLGIKLLSQKLLENGKIIYWDL